MRQPWYPVQERYGLIFAYMGPPEKKPVLPRYDCLEMLEPGEFVEADDSSIGSGGGRDRALQLAAALRERARTPSRADPARRLQRRAVRGADGHHAESEVGILTVGVKTHLRPACSTTADVHYRVTEAALPTLRVVPNPRVERYPACRSLGWTLPIDDTHFRIYVAGRVRRRASSAPSARA